MPIVRLDLNHLNELAGVRFDFNDLSEFVELVTIYVMRFQEEQTSPVPAWMLRDWCGFNDPRVAEVNARRAFVSAIADIWRSRGGKTIGSYYSDLKDGCEGSLLDLLEALLRGVDSWERPSRDTLHHDLRFIATGRERNRAR